MSRRLKLEPRDDVYTWPLVTVTLVVLAGLAVGGVLTIVLAALTMLRWP